MMWEMKACYVYDRFMNIMVVNKIVVYLLKIHQCEITWNANLMQQGNFINIFLAQRVSGTYTHHQEHWMLCCSIWFSAPSFWIDGGLESRCVDRVRGCTICTAHTIYAAALKTTIHPKARFGKPYAATQHPVLLMMGVCTQNMSS